MIAWDYSCEVGIHDSGAVYMPADGAKQQCAEAVAALRAIPRPGALGSNSKLTVQGVVSIVNCTMSVQINNNPETFVESAAAYAEELGFDGLNLDWEACPYYCDAHPIDCGTGGWPPPDCKCSPAGFGTGVAETANALGARLLESNRTVTLAIGVLKKGTTGQIVTPPYVYPNISEPGSPHPTSDITRLLRTSPFIERVTDMDTYSQNATDPELNHPHCELNKHPSIACDAWVCSDTACDYRLCAVRERVSAWLWNEARCGARRLHVSRHPGCLPPALFSCARLHHAPRCTAKSPTPSHPLLSSPVPVPSRRQGLGAYQAPFRDPATDKANLQWVLEYLDQIGVVELDLFAIDSRPGARCKTCAPGWPGPTPPKWWWPLLRQWKAARSKE